MIEDEDGIEALQSSEILGIFDGRHMDTVIEEIKEWYPNVNGP